MNDERRLGRERIGPTTTRPAFVRPATAGDEEVLCRLRGQAFADMAQARGGAMYVERHAAPLPPLVADFSGQRRRAWLGGLAEAELGYLLGAVEVLPSGVKLGVIEGIYVEADARACGIGELLMAVATAWFRSEECVGIEANALPGDRATKNFFEEHGLTARLLTVFRTLGAAESEGS